MLKILFGFFLSALFAIYGTNGYGDIWPMGTMYRRVGETIEIQCVLEGWAIDRGLSSVNLSFSTPHYNITKEQIKIVNDSTILLRIENAPEMDTRITCKIDDSDGVDQIHVYVGYPPNDVQDFHCISENSQNMVCTFRRSINPIVPDYKLYYGYSVSRPHNLHATQPCELSEDGDLTFQCKIELDYSKSGLYRPNFEYYFFKLFAVNELGNQTEEFIINHYDSIRPGKMINLTTSNETPDSVELTFIIPPELAHLERQFVFSISVKSEYEKDWTNVTIGPVNGIIEGNGANRHVTVPLKNLQYPHAWYGARIGAKVAIKDEPNSNLPDLWSDISSIYFKTPSRVPDEPPNTDIGAFCVNDYGHLYLYFEELPVWKHNGKDFHYIFNPVNRPMLRPIQSMYNAKFEDVPFTETEDVTFAIHSANSEGLSRQASYLRVPPMHEQCPVPTQIKKIEFDRQTYDISWQPPVDGLTEYCPEITSYTVFWCNTKSDSPNSCNGFISFQRVNRNEFHFRQKSKTTLNFAISANSHHSSSGMIWAKCTAMAGSDLRKLTSIYVSSYTSTSIEFRWELQCIEQTLVREYILHFCPIKDDDEYFEPNRQIVINRGANEYNLTGLLPDTIYKAHIQIISESSSGPLSDAIVTQTLAAPLPSSSGR